MSDQQVAEDVEGLWAEVHPPVVAFDGDEPVEFTVRVVNRTAVIETVDLTVTGLAVERVTYDPPVARLFPEELVEVRVTVVPAGRPRAGSHQLQVEVTGASATTTPATAPLTVEVPPLEDVDLAAEPPVRTGGRGTTFAVAVQNTGNTQLTAQLRVRDQDQTLRMEIDRPVITVAPGATEVCELRVRGKRPLLGGVTERVMTIDLTAGDLERTTETRFRQRPRLSPGVLTLLTLAMIGALWALAMLFGVTTALAPPEPTKVLPASFAAVEGEDGVGGGIGLDDLDPATVGGTISGQVVAVSTGRPAARATVEAFDTQGRSVAATATDDDGTFTLDALLPTRYRLRVRGPGFTEQWWPDSPTPAGAELLPVSPTAPVEDVTVELVGAPASIGGVVLTGDIGVPVPVSVTVESLDVVEGTGTAATTTAEDGTWSVAGLAAPGTYRISLEAPGYQLVEVTQPVDPGGQVVLNTVRLPAATGSIAGRIVDRDGQPLGGVSIEATLGELSVSTVTPTDGAIGSFVLDGLETPATYLVTLSGEGRSSETRAVRLEPGESLTDLEIELVADTGVITGTATTPDGTPLGDVTVTVRGGGTTLTAETLTSGQVGRFRLPDVPLPGTYTVTLEAEGRQPRTVRAELTATAPEADVSAALPSAEGRVVGRVVDRTGAPVVGVDVTVSDGAVDTTATTASSPVSQAGRFVVDGLAPGSYTITVETADGSRTLLRRVVAGDTTSVEVVVGGAR